MNQLSIGHQKQTLVFTHFAKMKKDGFALQSVVPKYMFQDLDILWKMLEGAKIQIDVPKELSQHMTSDPLFIFEFVGQSYLALVRLQIDPTRYQIDAPGLMASVVQEAHQIFDSKNVQFVFTTHNRDVADAFINTLNGRVQMTSGTNPIYMIELNADLALKGLLSFLEMRRQNPTHFKMSELGHQGKHQQMLYQLQYGRLPW
jgi:hypothetical protein